MMEKKVKSVVTHYRDFHADDVFAIAMLKILYPKIKIIRSEYSDQHKITSADIRVDIGGKYNPDTLDFDHHQPEGAGIRKNGIPYASCGLVWHHFGREICKNDRIFNEIDIKIIQTLDAIDNGVEISEVKIMRPYTISDYVLSLNPQWPEEKLHNFDKKFEFAVEFATHVLETEIDKIERRIASETKLIEYIQLNKSKIYLILYEKLPWREYIIERTSYKYVIELDEITKSWRITSVPIMVGSFDVRHNFPRKWAGLKGKDLENASGIKDSIFCHRDLFFAVAKSKESAIKMVENSISIR